MKATLVSLLLLVGVSCSSSESLTLSEAFCNDLRDGASLFSLYSVVARDMSTERFADKAYGYAATSCPEQLTGNARLRDFLQVNGIDPDA
jgi:hypothetical protein